MECRSLAINSEKKFFFLLNSLRTNYLYGDQFVSIITNQFSYYIAGWSEVKICLSLLLSPNDLATSLIHQLRRSNDTLWMNKDLKKRIREKHRL